MELEVILIWLMVLPTFLGAISCWIFDKIWKQYSRTISILSTGIAGLSAIISVILYLTDSWGTTKLSFAVLEGTNSINLVISPDGLSLFMATIAAFLGFLIVIFSIEYMSHDLHLTRYWFFLQLFIFAMVLLVIAGDLITMYGGWEIVGLCSYGLIAHWFEQEEKAAKSGIKAFVFTRIGDIGFLVSIVLIYRKIGSVEFNVIESQLAIDSGFFSLIGILFLLAAFGKSAQFPFIPWLSSPETVDVDAMQGPTTVSALIHAATMVKAGIYLIARLFILIPLWHSELFVTILVVVAGLTALITALSAVVSFDLKRILAYSTVSQLAYMFLALAMGYLFYLEGDHHEAETAFLASQFHLISHALFKSLLFLTAGYLIHKFGNRDIRQLRGSASWQTDNIAFTGIIVGGLALAGIFPLVGFFSKEAIIGSASTGIETGNNLFVFAYAISVFTALITAIYVGRMFFYLFTPTIQGKHDEDSGILMQSIIVILSSLVIISGLLQLIIPSIFDQQFDNPAFHAFEGSHLISSIILTIILAGLIYLVYWSYSVNPEIGSKIDKIKPIGWVNSAAKSGFYLEDAWSSGFNILKNSSYLFRKTHSGNLNYTISLITLVSAIVTIAFIGGT